MAYLTNLADVARRTGFPVVEEYGWRSRGHGSMGKVRSITAHHDAADLPAGTFNTVIRDGHSTLDGPLSHYALRRDGTIHVVAAGLCWHAGVTINPWLYGNKHAIGIEAGNDGVGEPWPQVQLDAYVALSAEIAKEFGLKTKRVRGHKEIAPKRKIDPFGINMNWFRSRVDQYRNTDHSGSDKSINLEDADMHEYLPAGGKLRQGGAEWVKWKSVNVPSVLREHDLVIGSLTGVHFDTINTWKYITADQAEARWGVSNKNPGGVGPLVKNAWVHGNTALSVVVPKGVATLHIAYASDSDVSVSMSPRKV